MKEFFSKYTPPIALMVLGLGLVGFGIATGQNMVFIIGGASILVAGIITLLNASGVITNKIGLGLAMVMVFIAGYLAYANYHSIDEPIQFMKEKARRYEAVIQNLKDLREAELAYKKQNNVYCASMDTLIMFLQNDSVNVIIKEGTVPDTLTEIQALEMGIIVRDTVRVPAFEYTFNETYMSTRNAKYPITDVNDLRYVPFTDNAEFEVQAGEITRSSGAKVQVFEITDTAPFDEKDVMKVGDMTQPSIAGNWKEEK